MANPTSNTYMAIPPPPLPEFYLAEKLNKTVITSSASGSDRGVEHPSAPRTKNSICQYPPTLDGTDERYLFTAASAYTAASKERQSSQDRRDGDLQPLAVYHICRICLRPRSARYHRDHPIPIDGVPPPPSICRRCRVSPADELRSVTEIIERPESNEIKLGVKCLVPDGEYISNLEMRDKQSDYEWSRSEWRELEPLPPKEPKPSDKTEVIHRHIHIAVPPPPLREASRAKSAEKPAGSRSTSYQSESERSSKLDLQHGVPPPPRRRTDTSTDVRKIDSNAASVSTQASKSVKCKHQSSYCNTAALGIPAQSERSESEIRRLARDEVERYRQAERRMDAHRQPYAHGRLVPMFTRERVPVERRIELQEDRAHYMPWKHTSEPQGPGKDSAFALTTTQVDMKKMKELKEMKEATATKEDEEDRHKSTQHLRMQDGPLRHESPRPPSSSASEKTRWPSTTQSRQYRVEEVEAQSSGPPTLAERKPRKYEVVEVVDDWEHPDVRLAVSADQSKVRSESQHESGIRRNPNHSDERSSTVGRSSTWKDTEYWRYEEPAPVADGRSTDFRPVHVIEQLAKEEQTRDSRASHLQGRSRSTGNEGALLSSPTAVRNRNAVAEIRAKSTTEQQARGSQPRKPPYPRDGQSMPLQMPSPSRHTSRNCNSPDEVRAPRDDDSEYYYVKRVVRPADRPLAKRFDDEKGDYYRETREYLHRRRIPEGDAPANEPQRAHTHPATRRPSDASSRVRFSNKVDISPTPPNSDANSSEFRSLGQAKLPRDDRSISKHEDYTVEYERRGRPRSRDPADQNGYYYEKDTIRSRQRGYRPAPNTDDESTPRPPRRPSGSSETATAQSTLPSNVKAFARVLSESPSREKLLEETERQRVDGTGPYHIEERRSASVEVEDGSSNSGSSCINARDHRERHVRSERHGRR
ncbi:Hypothetical predicted protein [Lecanosticta acicola]|uniref:Uncharacterized protein n=1 Tax=Lecanosticta acicola TaxID=111012 RepID=A0AAI9EDV9_9PEZI|nr:Hypothetical predicted protein [Lecanosticta acicola]